MKQMTLYALVNRRVAEDPTMYPCDIANDLKHLFPEADPKWLRHTIASYVAKFKRREKSKRA